MTDEGQSITDKWIESKGAEYAYAFDKKRAVHGYFGVKGIPDAVLIDATGTVVWRGHPGALDDSQVEKALGGALSKPLWDWPKEAKSAASALRKGQYAKALGAVEKVRDEDVRGQIEKDIRGLIELRVKQMTRALEEGNYLGAQTLAEALRKDLDGLEQAAAAEKVLADVEAAPDAEEVLELQEEIAKIRKKDPTKKADIQKAIEKLKEIRAEAGDNYARKEAAQLIEMLERRKRT